MKKSLISMKLKSFISSRAVVLSTFLVLLVGFFVVGLSGRSVSQPSVTRPSGTAAQRAEQATTSEQYTRVELADVKNYATASANSFVVTSGTVAGIKDSDELVLGDGKSSYVLVTFARAFTDVFAQTFSTLKIGDVVEVKGMIRVVNGILVNSPDGTTIEIGVDPNASSFGAISLTEIKKIE